MGRQGHDSHVPIELNGEQSRWRHVAHLTGADHSTSGVYDLQHTCIIILGGNVDTPLVLLSLKRSIQLLHLHLPDLRYY